jgi:hypothetical protein
LRITGPLHGGFFPKKDFLMNPVALMSAQPGIIAYLWACADPAAPTDEHQKLQEQMFALANVLIDVFLSKRNTGQYETQEPKTTVIQ